MNPITEKQYYQETDKEKRKKILEAAIEAEGMNPEDELRLELWERRYGRREKEPEGIDRYIRGWMGMVYLNQSSMTFLVKRRAVREIRKVKEDWDVELLKGRGELGEKLMYQELYNLIRFYMELCATDRNYTTTLFGMMRMDEEKVVQKIAKEIYTVAYEIPKSLDMEEEFQILRRAARDAFADQYPRQERLLGDM